MKRHAQINLSICKPGEEHKLLYQHCLQISPRFEFSDRFSNSEVTNLDNSTDWLRIWAFVLPVTDLGQSDVNLTCLCYHKLLGGQSAWVQKVREEAEKMRTAKRCSKKRGQRRRGKQRGGRNEDNEEETENKRQKKRGPPIRNL